MYSRTPTAVKTAFGRSGTVPEMWQPGDPIVIREIWNGAVFEARPAIVVQDLPAQTMLYVPAGNVCGVAVDDAGVQLRFPDREWHLQVRERHGVALSFAWPDTPYAVLLLSEPDGLPRGWYVNIQAPLARTPVGFDTVDHALDVLISLDRSSWTWKDEDELAEAIALGLFTEADAAAFRYWGERAVEHLVLRLPPFDQAWEEWRPDPSWPTPELPPGWDRV
jgi:uncharacterized protein DUF402